MKTGLLGLFQQSYWDSGGHILTGRGARCPCSVKQGTSKRRHRHQTCRVSCQLQETWQLDTDMSQRSTVLSHFFRKEKKKKSPSVRSNAPNGAWTQRDSQHFRFKVQNQIKGGIRGLQRSERVRDFTEWDAFLWWSQGSISAKCIVF